MLSQLLDSMPEAGEHPSLAGRVDAGGITLTSGGGYLPAGSALDPCHPCVALVANFDLPPEMFAAGVLST